MPLFTPAQDDEVITDVTIPIVGVNSSVPPSVIQPNEYESAENRLTQRDGLNRPRPGRIKLAQIGVNFDSISHLGLGVYLVNNAGLWYEYSYLSNALTPETTSPPAYSLGDQVFSTLANNVLYFSNSFNRPADTRALYKYSSAGGFATVPLNTNGPYAAFPVWCVYRLMYAYQNTLIVSDALAPETFDVATGSVTLDPITTDQITGISQWQDQNIALFRNGSTYVVMTGPGLDVPNWSVNRISATVGCRCHGTIVQTETDVFFLSETGRGVYALSQAPASSQQGVWVPISVNMQSYIDRINWNACDNARATYWNDLYILAVPLDGANYNNYMLIYSIALNSWQGVWCFEIGGSDVAARDFARDRTYMSGTVLMVGTKDGILSNMSYPTDRKYWDQEINGTHTPFNSDLLSRSFTMSGDALSRSFTGTGDRDVNQVRPHSVRLRFMESADPVDITVWGDRALKLHEDNYPTTTYLLSLTIPGFPFDLDTEGYCNVPISLMNTGICTEFQVELSGPGNWTLFQIKASMLPSMPMIAR